jgi:hypothetical protein
MPPTFCPPGLWSVVRLAGDHPAGHQDLLIEVTARAHTVVAIIDPQRDPLEQEHGDLAQESDVE